jgi:hypothetical protein
MPMKRPKRPGLERVGAGERRVVQRQEAIEEAVVLNEIARHHRIGHGSGDAGAPDQLQRIDHRLAICQKMAARRAPASQATSSRNQRATLSESAGQEH